MHYFIHYLQPFIDHFGCIGIGIMVFLESMGLPLPAESLLIATVVYSVKSHHIDINALSLTTIISAIAGDSVGYFIGYKLGSKSVNRLTKKFHIKPINFVTLRYLFRRFGGVVVILGRFFAVMRVTVPLVAGSLEMPWLRFLFFNIFGGVIWGSLYTYGIYYGGSHALTLSKPVFITAFCIVAIAGLTLVYLFHRYFNSWSKKALSELSEEEKKDLGF